MESFRSPAIFCIFVPEEQDTLRSVTAGHRETVNTSLPHVVRCIKRLSRTYTGVQHRQRYVPESSGKCLVKRRSRMQSVAKSNKGVQE